MMRDAFEPPGGWFTRASEVRRSIEERRNERRNERTNEAHSCRVPLLAHRTMTNYELNSPHRRPIRPYKRRHHRESLFLSTSLRVGFSAFSLHPIPFFPLFLFSSSLSRRAPLGVTEAARDSSCLETRFCHGTGTISFFNDPLRSLFFRTNIFS